jgi:hypothetical protein
MSKEKNLPKLKETKDVPPDDPLKRHEDLESDIECGGKGEKIADLRHAALEQTRRMPTSEEK